MRLFFLAVLQLLAFGLVHAADFNGTWRLNLEKSHSDRELRAETYKIEEKGSDTYRTTIETVYQSGPREFWTIDRTCDGKERPIRQVDITLKTESASTPGFTEECHQLDDSTRTVIQRRNGAELSRFTLTISTDGKTMRQVREENPKETLVFERQ